MRVIERPRFTTAFIGQFNPLSRANNVVTLSLVCNMDFVHPSTVHISGLVGVASGLSGQLPFRALKQGTSTEAFGIQKTTLTDSLYSLVGWARKPASSTGIAWWWNGTLSFMVLPDQVMEA
eukprot:2776362-Rhodomonas_salina.1